jgi:hypothetical protein
MSGNRRPRLQIIQGRRDGGISGSLRISVVTPEEALSVDAVVFEEDTWLILSAGLEVAAPVVHPVRLFTELHEAEPLVPGTVLVRDEQPLTLLAVVHDFGSDPCCRHEWISAALDEVLRICRERQVTRLLLPLFGVRHGAMKPAEIVPLVIRTIRGSDSPVLTAVFLNVPPGVRGEAGRLIAAG